jgi:hypothetical protein
MPAAATAVAMQGFKSRVGSMRKGLKSRARFLFQDAPFHVSNKRLSVAAPVLYPAGWYRGAGLSNISSSRVGSSHAAAPGSPAAMSACKAQSDVLAYRPT